MYADVVATLYAFLIPPPSNFVRVSPSRWWLLGPHRRQQQCGSIGETKKKCFQSNVVGVSDHGGLSGTSMATQKKEQGGMYWELVIDFRSDKPAATHTQQTTGVLKVSADN